MDRFDLRIAYRVIDLTRPMFVSRSVRVTMDEQQVNFGFVRQYALDLSLQHRASAQPGVAYRGKRYRRANYHLCATIGQ